MIFMSPKVIRAQEMLGPHEFSLILGKLSPKLSPKLSAKLSANLGAY